VKLSHGHGYGGAVALLVAALHLASCAPSGIRAPVGGAGDTKPWHTDRVGASDATHHVVRVGETLYSIAWDRGLNYRDLAMWNRIPPPYTIYPGQRLTVVPVQVHSRARHSRTTTTASRSPARDSGAATTAPQSRVRDSNPPASVNTKNTGAPAEKETGQREKLTDQEATWHWPAKGELITTFMESGHKGVNIAGQLGQPVYAAAGGRVVYSGGGLRGYGELIIIKHNHRYLSAYAHNNKLLVREGDQVTGGERIAEMGRSGTSRVMLHFEIRRDGKPVDPTAFLPKR
jgi:lipoprotein NlpD